MCLRAVAGDSAAVLPTWLRVPPLTRGTPWCACWAAQGHIDEIFSCAFNYEGDTIITGSKDNTCRIWKC